MKIGIKFNRLTYREYIYILDRYQKYTDFNPLALYRSIIENNKLDLTQKIAIRDLAHQQFAKFFEFLQIKDPYTYIAVSTLGETLTNGDESKLWGKIIENQEKILKAKRIKHRNFGIYSRYNQTNIHCPFNGAMVRRDGGVNPHLASAPSMHFGSDKNWFNKYESAKRRSAKKRAFRDNKVDIET
ncbi:hypothetical protein [Chamaesiphon polymorphus]|uniref:Uncharacterized protein n=1 Tax=Chamaesiphon polymorphus CCALA 037 TaxID=2107692 RepID=A0A2T1FZA8_9CYAN|nr:hypothetical protein [Chamaesiphon polymorphus]PSB50327.1 hypothetical protein C7B77_22890 [Chamaesiphon polymorphus CCALA 037]